MRIQIAENIKRLRTERGLTQSDLATLVSVSPQAVSRWESGQAYPDVELLPLLANYLEVSLDELMGGAESKIESLKKALDKILAEISKEPLSLENELRVLHLYEELAPFEQVYLLGYYHRLMSTKRKYGSISEERIANARKLIRERMRVSDLNDRLCLLNAVARDEDEDKLCLWEDEYKLPEFIKFNFWDEMLLQRYENNIETEKYNIQNQKIIFEHIENTIHHLIGFVPKNFSGRFKELKLPQSHKAALDTINLYSSRIDDVFIMTRIVAEFQYAESLFANERDDEGFEMLAVTRNHLSVLLDMPDSTVLRGSVPIIDTVCRTISKNDIYANCIMNIIGYDKSPIFDRIRDDRRFVEFFAFLENWLPKRPCRLWVNEYSDFCIDAEWKILLSEAQKTNEQLSEGNVVVMQSEKGNVYSIVFQNTDSAVDADGGLKLFVELKKNCDTKIERLLCMWHDGTLDLPSYAFREMALKFDRGNLSAKILLCSLNSYTVRNIGMTMPGKYVERLLNS